MPCDPQFQTEWVVTSVYDLSTAQLVATPSTICAGQTVTLSFVTPSGQWIVDWLQAGSGLIQTTGPGPSHSITVTPTQTTDYAIEVSGLWHNVFDVECLKREVHVTVNPVPVIHRTPDQTINCGESVTLSATGDGTYSWNTTPPQTTASISVAPTATTNYTVTVTNQYGCSSTADVLVSVNANPPVIATTGTACDVTVLHLTDPEPGLTYNWTVPTGVTIVSGQGTGTLTIDWNGTEGTGGEFCVSSICGEACVYISRCCEAQNITELTGTLTGNQTFTNQTLLVTGNLILDGNSQFTFTGCEVIMNPYANIHCINGADIVLNQTHVHECDVLHMGITLDDPGSWIKMYGGSKIEGGYIGLSLSHEALFTINDSYFDRNFAHISVYDYPLLSSGTPTITNSTFSCSSSMPVPLDPSLKTHTAISVNTAAKFMIGPGVSITEGAKGIYLRNAPLDIYQCSVSGAHIQDMGAPLGLPYSGVGIHSEGIGSSGLKIDDCVLFENLRGAHLEGNNKAIVVHNFFKNNPMGMYLNKNYNCKVRDNDYLTSFIGIYSNTDSRTLITENRFDQNILGIISSFDRSQEIMQNKFYYNSVGMPTWAGYGIFVQNAASLIENSVYLYSTHIDNNKFFGTRVGIEVLGTKTFLVEQNKVYLDYHSSDPGAFYSKGIHLNQCTRALVSDNEIFGGATANDGGTWDRGLSTDNCALTRMVCNTTQDLHIGILNGGMALSTYMFDNTMQGYHHRGLIQNHGLLGQQGSITVPTDNQWDGTYGAYHTQTIQSPSTTLSFHYRLFGFNTPYRPDPFQSASTQVNQLYEIIPTFSSGTASPYDCPVDWRNSEALLKFINDSIVLTGPDSLALYRLGKLELYKAIMTDSILQLDTALVAFANSFAQTDLGRLASLSEKLSPGIPDSVAWAYSDKVGSIAATDELAGNWQKVLMIAFSTWADSDSSTVLSESDSSLFRDLAQRCPYTDGPVVGLARTLLFSPDEAYFKLTHECEVPYYYEPENRIGHEDSGTNGDRRSIVLSPNPTTGQLVVTTTGYENVLLDWSATDLTGKRLLSGRLTGGSINLGSLEGGTYLVTFRQNNRMEHTEKVVLIK